MRSAGCGSGVVVSGVVVSCAPVEVVETRPNNTHLLKFVLSEGRKRQIRKMCSAAHLVVLALKRVKVGGFVLPDEVARLRALCPRFEFRTVGGAGHAPHLEAVFLGEAGQAVLDFLGRA